MRPAVHAFQKDHVHLLQECIDGINNFDAVLLAQFLRIAFDAIATFGHIGTADGAEQDGVVFPELVPAVVRHHLAMLLVEVGAPRETVPFERGTVVAGDGGIRYADGLLDHFRTDTIAADDCDA